jgi:hypothetical protein
MVQPELLPGAVALVGKMASDAAKKTVINIATTEGKKVGAAIGKDISNDASTVPAQTETPRPTNQEATSSELALSAPKNVVEVAKAASPPEKAKAAPVSTPEQPAIFRQETKPLVLAAAASITSTTTTTKTTNGESATQLEKTMVTISQESLDLLHQSIFPIHSSTTALISNQNSTLCMKPSSR